MQEQPQQRPENVHVPEQIVLSQLLAVINIGESNHTRALLVIDSSGFLQTLPLPNDISAEKYLETSLQTNVINIPIQSEAYTQYRLMQVDDNNRLPHIDFSEYSKLYCAEVRVQEPMEYHDSLNESDSISIPVLEKGEPKFYYFTDKALCKGLQDALTVSTKKETVLLVPIKGDKISGKAWVLAVALNTENNGALGRSGAAGELFLGKFIDALYHDKEPKLGGERRPFLKRLIEYCEITPEKFVDEIIKQVEAALANLIEQKKGLSLIAARLDIARVSGRLRKSLSKQINNIDAILNVTTRTNALASEELLNQSNSKPEYRNVVEPLLEFKNLDILLYGLLHEALLEETGAYYRPAEILTELKALGEYLLTGYAEESSVQVLDAEKNALEKPSLSIRERPQLLTPLQLKQQRPQIPEGLKVAPKRDQSRPDSAQPKTETANLTSAAEVGTPLPMLLERSQYPPQQYTTLTRGPNLIGQNTIALESHAYTGNDITIYLTTHRPSRYESNTTYSVSIQSPRVSQNYVQRLDTILNTAFRNGSEVTDEQLSYPGITIAPGEVVRFQNQLGQYIEFTLTYTGKNLEVVGSNLFAPPIIPEDSRIRSDAQAISVLSYPTNKQARKKPSKLRSLFGKTRKSDWSTVGQIEENIYYSYTEVALSLPRNNSYNYYLTTNYSNVLSNLLNANELLNARKLLSPGDMIVAYSPVTDTSEYLVYTKAGLLVSFKRKGRPETPTKAQQTNERTMGASISGVIQLKKQTVDDLGARLNNKFFVSSLPKFSHRLQSYVFDEMTVFPDEKGGLTVYDGPPLGISLHHSEHPYRVGIVFEPLPTNSEPIPSISVNGRSISQRNLMNPQSERSELIELAIWDVLIIQQQNGSQTTLILTPEKTLQVIQNRNQRETRVDVVQSFEHPTDIQVVGYLGSSIRQPDLGKPQQNLEKVMYWPNIAFIHSTIRSNNQQGGASVTSVDPKRFLLFYASQNKSEITQTQLTYCGSHVPKLSRNDQVIAFDAFTGNSFLLTVDKTGMILSSEMPRTTNAALTKLVRDIAEFELRKEQKDDSDLPTIAKTRRPNSKITIDAWNVFPKSEVRIPFIHEGPPITIKVKNALDAIYLLTVEIVSSEDPNYHNFVVKKNGKSTMSSELKLQRGDIFSCYDPETDTELVFLYTFSRSIEIIRSNAWLSNMAEYQDGRISRSLPSNYEIIGHLGNASENISFIQAGYHQKKIPWLQLGSIIISSSPTTATLTTNSSYQYYKTSPSARSGRVGSGEPISPAGSLLSLTHGSHIVATTPFSAFEYHLQVLQSGFIVTYTKTRTDL